MYLNEIYNKKIYAFNENNSYDQSFFKLNDVITTDEPLKLNVYKFNSLSLVR